MRIQISDPFSTPQLILFLRKSGIAAFREKKEGELNVIGNSTDAVVQAVLATWNDIHKDATAKIVGQEVYFVKPSQQPVLVIHKTGERSV